MPESEPKPKLIELVAPGAGQGWKSVLRNGKAAVLHEIPAPAAEAAAALPRIQRLAENRHPALAPVLAWGTDPNGLWYAVEPNEGTPLGAILSRGPLTPPAAAALGAALLSGVAALHEAGIASGGFGAAAVRVTGNGEVRLSGHPAAAVRGAPSQSDLRADVRSCGMAICAAFGVDPAGAPAPQNIPPGLVVTMRSMASGAMGPAADRAQGALREMAAALLAPDRMTAAQSELALRAGGREMPSITPFLPKEEAAAQAAPPPPVAPPPAPRVDETPLPRSASYEPPPRGAETYPPPPAPPAPPPAAQQPTGSWETPAASPQPTGTWQNPPSPPTASTWSDPAPAATPPETPAFPTWSEPEIAAPPAPSPYEPPAASAPAEARPSGPLSWEPAPPAPAPAPAEPSPPAAAPYEPPPAAPAPYEPPARASEPAPPAPAPADRTTWTSVPTPSWSGAKEPAEKEPEPFAAAVPAPAATSTQAPSPIQAPAPTPARKPPATRRPSRDQPSGRPPWLVPAIAAIVLLLLIGVGGGIFLASRGGGGGGTPTTTPSAKTSPKVSPSPSATGGPRAVPTYAPATAAPVTSVAFCKADTHPCSGLSAGDYTNCKINGPCKVTVEITFSSAQRTDVAYIVKYFDRCTGTTTDLPGKHFTPPGYTRVDLTATLSLPTGAKSAALVAVSTTPASAASAPLLLGSDTC